MYIHFNINWYWSFFLSGEYVTSSVLSHHNKNLKRWTSVTALRQTVSQLLNRSVLQLHVISQFYLENEGKCIIEAWGYAYPKDAKRRQTPGRPRPFGSSFCMFYPPPLGLLCVNWASQECCSLYPRSSLQPSDLLCSISRGFSHPCLLATTILDSFFPFLTI